MPGRKRVGSGSQAEISLFPFLAVLLCTAGMLVMLLVLVSQGSSDRRSVREDSEKTFEKGRLNPNESISLQAGSSAKTVHPSSNSSLKEKKNRSNGNMELPEFKKYRIKYQNASFDDLLDAWENSNWYLEQLQGIKTRTEESLRKERDNLAGLEKMVADQLTEAQRLAETVRALADPTLGTNPIEELRRQIETRKGEIEKRKGEIVRLQEQRKEAKPVYSIVPYQGKNGTKRCPIFIECNQNGVFLMPEGYRFQVTDFLLGKYPGNPFDAGILAARQAIMDREAGSGEKLEPYPLLIVRPGGEEAYYLAMSALASWGGEYGYELVDKESELAYPASDPQKSWQIEQQVATARAKYAVPLATLIVEARRKASQGTGGSNTALVQNGFNGRNASGFGWNGNQSGFGSGSGSNTNVGRTSDENPLFSQFGDNVRIAPVRVPGQSETGSGSLAQNSGSNIGQNSSFGNGLNSGKNSGFDFNLNSGFYSGGGSNLGGSYGMASNSGLTEAIPLPAYTGIYSGNSGSAGGIGINAVNSTQTNMTQANTTNTVLSTGTVGSTVNANPVSAASGVVSYPGINTSSNNSDTTQIDTTQVNTSSAAVGTSSTGMPVDSSKQLLSMVQQQEANNNAPTQTNAVKGNNWEQVGNMTYAQNGTGTVTEGSVTAGAATNSSDSAVGAAGPQMNINKKMKDPKEEKNSQPGFASSKSVLPGKAINLNDEMRRPVNQAAERPIRIECRPEGAVFPRQPGLRNSYSVAPTANGGKFNKELLETAVLCIKGWGAAGKNKYWVPWVSIKIYSGGEKCSADVERIFASQGITVKKETVQ